MRRRYRIGLLAAAAPLALAACSGGGSTNSALDLSPTPTVAPSSAGLASTPAATARAPRPTKTATATHAASATPTHASGGGQTHRPATHTPTAHATTTHTSKPSPKPKPASTFVIKALDYSFSPANPTVAVGTTVKVVDAGMASHTWTSGTAPVHRGPFDSGNLGSGQSYSYTFHSAGSYNFFCKYHYSSGMKGSIRVQ